MKILFIAVILLGCNGSRTFGPPDPDPIIIPQTKPKPIQPRPYIPPEPVTWGHWICCKNLCGKNISDVRTVAREQDTAYVVCDCKDGRLFRVSRLKRG